MAQSADPIVEFFDRRADEYYRDYVRETPGGFASRVRIRKTLALFDRPGGDVLDVGCGPAVIAEPLLKQGCRYWGIDPAIKMLDIARSRLRDDPRTCFVEGKATHLDFSDDSFDAVVCISVIDSVDDPGRAISEMVRVLKPGGNLILTFTNGRSPYAWWKNEMFYPVVATWHRVRFALGDRKVRPTGIRAGGRRKTFSPPRVGRLIESAGARVVQHVPCYFNVFLAPLDELMPRLALRFTEWLEDAVWARPDWIAAGWILKATKI